MIKKKNEGMGWGQVSLESYYFLTKYLRSQMGKKKLKEKPSTQPMPSCNTGINGLTLWHWEHAPSTVYLLSILIYHFMFT